MEDNKSKWHSGKDNQDSLLTLLLSIKERGIISQCSSPCKCGYEGMHLNQFYAPFVIEFQNSTQWIFFTTNSFKNDRLKSQQWDAYHIKKIKSTVSKAYLIISDEESNKKTKRNEIENKNNQIQNKIIYSAIDGIISQKDVENLVLSYVNSLLREGLYIFPLAR